MGEIAKRFELILEDAAYGKLACLRALPLATLDTKMRRARRGLGLRLLILD